jgi:hypothetical protein
MEVPAGAEPEYEREQEAVEENEALIEQAAEVDDVAAVVEHMQEKAGVVAQ